MIEIIRMATKSTLLILSTWDGSRRDMQTEFIDKHIKYLIHCFYHKKTNEEIETEILLSIEEFINLKNKLKSLYL
jgi:hypothetical protein